MAQQFRIDQIAAGEPPRIGERIFLHSWPSRADLREDILAQVGGVLIAGGWVAATDEAWLRLCLDEALTNALYHGNEGDPRLLVTVEVRIGEREWQVLVTDQGEGFTPGDIPRQETPEDLQREHGRGIRLMQEWLDGIDYWCGGRQVCLRRRRADRPDVPDSPA